MLGVTGVHADLTESLNNSFEFASPYPRLDQLAGAGSRENDAGPCHEGAANLPKCDRSRSSSALKQINNQDDDGNHQEQMNQTAADVADQA